MINKLDILLNIMNLIEEIPYEVIKDTIQNRKSLFPLEFLSADVKLECFYVSDKIVMKIRKVDSLKSFEINLKEDNHLDEDLIIDLIEDLNNFIKIDYLEISDNQVVNINKIISDYRSNSMKGVEFS